MNNRFAYNDELDKCYGITGTVISLNVLDNEYMIQRISLDTADDEETITFTPDFFFCANPRFSAKIAWNEMLKQYQLLIGMVVGNILCRNRVHGVGELSPDAIHELKALVEDEGHDECSLDDDEIETVFNKTFRYLDSFFSDSRVHYLADAFATCLQQRRSLSGDEIVEQLNYLRR